MNDAKIIVWGSLNPNKECQDRARVLDVGGVCQSVRATDYKDPPKVAIELEQVGQLERVYESRGRVYSPDGLCPTISTMCGGSQEPKITVVGRINSSQDGVVVDPCGIAKAHTSGHNNSPKIAVSGIYTGVTPAFQRGPLEGMSRTLKAVQHDAGVCEGFRVRKLTPKECWRLMDFTDEDFEKAKWVMPEEVEEFLKANPKHKGRKQYTHGQRIERMSNSQLYKQAGNSIVKSVLMAIFGEMIG